MKGRFLNFWFILLLFACGRTEKPESVNVAISPTLESKPEQIVIFILPGRGLKPIYNILEGAKSNNQLLKLRTSGMLETNTFLGEKPDDRAYLTSIFIGKTTFRGSMGLNKDSLPEPNLFQAAQEAGFYTAFLTPGLIADTLTGSIFGHHKEFSKEAIAWDLSSGIMDYFFGYGRIPFERRKDKKNVFKALSQKGYQIAMDSSSISQLKRGKSAIVTQYSSGENQKKFFKYVIGQFMRRNFSKQKVFMVVYFPPYLQYEEGFEMEVLAEFLERSEHNDKTLTICLSYPRIFDADGKENLRSSIGGVSSLLTYGPKKEEVMGLHSSTDFGNYIRKVLQDQ